MIHDVVELHGEFLPVVQLTQWTYGVDVASDLSAFLQHLVEEGEQEASAQVTVFRFNGSLSVVFFL